jgi:SAM-dependent methyltransferase
VLCCADCGAAFLEEFPDAEARQELYQGDYYDEGSGGRFLRPLEALVRAFRRARARDILRRLPPAVLERRDAMLDVGCGRGLLLDAFLERSWSVAGTQLSRTAAQSCERRSGAKVHVGELPELALEEAGYRLVTFYHVLEHVGRPLEYLREARRLLRPDGLLVVEVPDAGSPAFRALGPRHFCVDHPHHLFFFSADSLRGLLDRAGFEVAGVSRFSLEYSPFTCLQNLLNWLPGAPNRLYLALMTNRRGAELRRNPLTWLHFAIGAALAPPAFLLSLAALFVPSGNTLRFYCHRSRDRGQAGMAPSTAAPLEAPSSY